MIWLLRHGDAEDAAEDDASRRLTEKGRQQARAAGAGPGGARRADRPLPLEPQGPRRARPRASPASALGAEVEISEALRGGDFDPVELAAGRGEVLLVGHEPDFSRAIQLVTGGRVELEKGGLAAIEPPVLASLLRPAELLRIGSGP